MASPIDWKQIAAIGLVLIGVGVLLGGYSLYKMFSDLETHDKHFFALCNDYYIEIDAKSDLENVRIWFDNKTVCSFKRIPAGVSRVCDATKYSNVTQTFVISTNKGEKTVICLRTQIIKPLPSKD